MKDTNADRVRRAALALAAALYAVAGSPTPDHPGGIEVTIIVLILLAVLPLRRPRGIWVAPLLALVAYGLTLPLIGGVLMGNDAADMLRDLVAFAALALPLGLAALYAPGHGRDLVYLMLGIGLVFSLRFLLGAAAPFGGPHDLLYLANSPLVAFAAAFLLLYGCFAARRARDALAALVLSVPPVLAMTGMMQRATLALLALAWCALLVRAWVLVPRRALMISLGFAALAALLWSPLAWLAAQLYDKTLAVGVNARGDELAALVDQLGQNPLTALFGAGWGALVKSPAVGDLWVRFSHALLSALLWKTGWIGLALAGAALAALTVHAWRRLAGDWVMRAALFLPLVPALFLYGSYKSFGFGLLLTGLATADWTKPKQEW
ncbi:MAG: hypothetical protein H6865_01555 [Rhodospirillales bacterium]|nr:hypothetical protein [Alphaproteobacteria bacterium]MCB9986304.1 hypothetical protein [Rhodospirillales bacterium]USO07143.1 MAG: hypothetical protein H6866_06830 [Rhodospirillales bacterium]